MGKRALRKKMNEGKYKQAMKVLKGGKGCKGAKVWVKTTIAHHAKAKVHLGKMAKALKKCHIGKKNAYQLYKGSKSFEKKVKVWEKNTRSHHARAKAHLGKMVKALKKCHIGKKNAYKVYKLAKHDEKKFKRVSSEGRSSGARKPPLCTSTVILVGTRRRCTIAPTGLKSWVSGMMTSLALRCL